VGRSSEFIGTGQPSQTVGNISKQVEIAEKCPVSMTLFGFFGVFTLQPPRAVKDETIIFKSLHTKHWSL
jgi:hypothetical protein